MIVYVKRQEREKLKEVFGCSASKVSVALNFKENSVLSRRIRDYAMNKLNGMLLT